MNKVTLCENALDPSTWTTHDCDDVRRFLVDHFGEWPETARIYLGRVGRDTDVTPYDEAGVERLAILHGHFFVVVFPAAVTTILLIVAIALSAVSVALSFLLRPALPENQQASSGTNSLTNRQNKERLGGRIPDIYGTLWVTPDLIGVPYRIFIGNKEVEYMYMCIGRGEYEIAEVRDDVTPIAQIDGAGCEIYGPNTSPNSGDAPQESFGEPVNTEIRNVKQYSSVNGQQLRAPNASKFKASNNVRFVDTGVVEGYGDVDFTDYFSAGTITNPKYLVISNSDYNGKYLILDVNPTTIVLSDPGSVNAAWNTLSGETAYGSPTLVNSADNWEGPFYILDNTLEELWCNFVAQQGLYKMDSDGNQHQVSVTVQIEVTSIDSSYNTQGSPVFYQTTLKGSETLRSQCGATLTATLPVAGSCQVRARRLTNTDLRDGWQVVDQVQWRDLYGVSPIWEETSPPTPKHFGNVTTIQTITWPTPQALSLKQRKINVLIGRKIFNSSALEVELPFVSFESAYPDAGSYTPNWEINGDTVIQSVNAKPSILLSKKSFSGLLQDKITGEFVVNDALGDDDFIGFVFNYQDDKHFCLFDWRRQNQTDTYYGYGSALIGMSVKKINSEVTITGADLFPSAGTTNCTLLDSNSIPWVNGTTYSFELHLLATGFIITIRQGNSVLASFTITDATWTSGKFGFYNYSQEDVTYSGFLAGPDIITGSTNAADILCQMALDPYIGGRTESEINRTAIQAVLGAAGEVETYFGTDLCTQFSYAFDDAKMSFEEMAAQVCQAVFCVAYRLGNVLSVKFEKETTDSLLLFNHRNKLPGSETRTVKFGTTTENDGIELTYVEPNAPNAQNIDSAYTLYFPEDQSAVAAKKITAIGVRNRVQAWMLGWRMYQKLRYQNTVTQFDATSEAALAVISDRILVADNTRSDTQDGEVLAQSGLELTLSQPVTFETSSPAPSYTIFLQAYDGTVEAIAITPGSADNKVVLAQAPAVALVVDAAKYARTIYMIVADTDEALTAFLLQEKDAKDGGVYSLKAVNYDARYYDHDQDYNASPRLIDVITPGDGTGAGYSKQASSSVYVDAKCKPWDPSDNPSFDFGINDGKPPVAVPIQAAEGETVAINANAPGAIASWWVFAFQTNTVRKNSDTDSPLVDAEGDDDQITGTTTTWVDGHGDRCFPTYHADTPPLGSCGLIGAWAKATSPPGSYQVVEPFVIGFGGNFTVPAGGVDTLLLGINDNKHSDNQGGFQVNITQTGTAAGDAAAEDPEPDTTTTDPNTTVYMVTANGA